jgi:ribose transport system ATP-binding protein
LEGIVKRFPGVLALDGASLSVRPGEVHGLIGENGAGKSTIIKVLGGVLAPDAGGIEVDGRREETLTPARVHGLGIRFVHQELSLVPHLSVAESIHLCQESVRGPFLARRAMDRAATRFLEESLGMSVPPGRLIRDLDPAARKLVQIARAMIDGRARLVVLDEPTAPLGATQVARVFEAIRRLSATGVAILYVSHYLSEIQEICDRVTVLREGRAVGIAEGADLRSSNRLIEMMVGRPPGELFPPVRRPDAAAPALTIEGLAVDGFLEEVSESLAPGEILGVAGLPGSGRDALVDAVTGLTRPSRGHVSVAGRRVPPGSRPAAARRGIALVPRDRRRSGLVLDLPVADNLTLAVLEDVSRHGVLDRRAVRARAEQAAAALDIRPRATATPARLLSGGNQQKVVLGRWTSANAPVLVLEEPTVGVDVSAKAEIYRIIAGLAARGAAVLVSSNDTEELAGLAHRILVLRRGRVVARPDTSAVDSQGLLALVTGLDAGPGTGPDAPGGRRDREGGARP